tara:strand:- start:538 stop:888 length:351 start_codon:yes stop_codon:yes gene_type:complete
MKKLLILTFLAFSIFSFSQEVKIKWEDSSGREFSISAPSGEFSYGMISGDRVSYNYSNKVSRVGSVSISYNYSDKVSRVGSVSISYDYSDRVSRVGGLRISYNYNGQISRTSGSVN